MIKNKILHFQFIFIKQLFSSFQKTLVHVAFSSINLYDIVASMLTKLDDVPADMGSGV